MVLCGLACVVIWEVIKMVINAVSGAWKAWSRKQRKVERLRERAEAAVRDELRRRAAEEPRTPRARQTLDIYGTPARAKAQPSSSSSETEPTHAFSRSWEKVATAATATSSLSAPTRTVSTQTVVWPGLIEAERLRAFEGLFGLLPMATGSIRFKDVMVSVMQRDRLSHTRCATTATVIDRSSWLCLQTTLRRQGGVLISHSTVQCCNTF